MLVILKSRNTGDRLPAPGDAIEFLNDHFADKGPAAGTVTATKVTVDGLYLKVKHSDVEQMFSWDDLQPHATRSGDRWTIKSIPMDVHRASHEPSDAQRKSGNYKKRKFDWRGLTIAIENEAGSVRSGVNSSGTRWESRMYYPYGYILMTDGVDGDHVDCFIGPDLDAPTVYVVHARKHGEWDAYDEDKCMIGFASEDDAKHAFLLCYDDPRFLGPITAIPAETFVDKVRDTKGDPKMVKSHIKGYTRKDGSYVAPHEDKRSKRDRDEHISQLEPKQQHRLHAMYLEASSHKAEFDGKIASIASAVSGTARHAPVKGAKRAVEKVLSDYAGDASKIKDLLRATVVAPNIEQAHLAIDAAREQFGELIGLRNGLQQNASTGADGYRDIKFNVRVGSQFAEVQINIAPMLDAKKVAHALYEQTRSIEARAKQEGRDLTNEELEKRVSLIREQLKIYADAWDSATKVRKSLSAIIRPLCANEDPGNGLPSGTSQAVKVKPTHATGMPSTSANFAPSGNFFGSIQTSCESRIPQKNLLIVVKAEQLSLFDMPVHVEGSTDKRGVYRKPHMAIRHKRIDSPHPAPSSPPAKEPEKKRNTLDDFVLRHGGAEHLRAELGKMTPEQRGKLIDAMARLDEISHGDVMRKLGMHQEDGASSGASTAPPHEIVEHVTGKGKTLRGVVRRDLNGHQAAAIDPYTFRKDGGWFIRERHLTAATPAAKQEPTATAAPTADSAEEEKARAKARDAVKSSKAQAEKLRAAGQKVVDQALQDQNRDRQTNTARRVRMANSADATARHNEAIGRTMLNLADAIESGDAKYLGGITSRAAVETLDRAVREAVRKTDSSLSYLEQQRNNGRDVTPDDIRNAALPQMFLHGNIARDIAEKLRGKKGYTKASAWAYKIHERIGSERVHQLHDGDLDLAREALKGLAAIGQEHAGWQLRDSLAARDRLSRIGIKTDADLRLALAEYMVYRTGKKKVDPIKQAERDLVGKKVGIDFFPTPKPLAARMAEMAGVKPGMKVLEPSAGHGNLADAAKELGADVDTVEISDTLRRVLEAKGHRIVDHNFEDFSPTDKYDAVIMNPPFSNRQDASHIQRAFEMLKPGGRMVAIAGEGVFNGSDSKAQAFRDWLDHHGAEIESLPDGTFMGADMPAQTGARARLITIDKGRESAATTDGPKEGDTKVEDGVQYVLRDHRWHRVDEPAAEPRVAQQQASAATSEPAAPSQDVAPTDSSPAESDESDDPQPSPELADNEEPEASPAVAAEAREDLADEMAKDPHSERTRKLVHEAAEAQLAPSVSTDPDDPSSPNYRFRDTGHVPGSRKELAAATIRAAGRKGERLRANDIDWEEIETNQREAKELIKKSNLFGTVDWEALKADGMDPAAGFLIDRVYASVGTEPDGDSALTRRDYALGLETLRDRMEKCRTSDQVVELLQEIRSEIEGVMMNAKESAEYRAAVEVALQHRERLHAAMAAQKAEFNKWQAIESELQPLEWAQQKRLRRGWKEDPELKRKIDNLKPQVERARQAYTAYLAAHPELHSKRRDHGNGWTSSDNDLEFAARQAANVATEIQKRVQARNVLENPLTRAWVTLGKRFLSVVHWRSYKGSDAFSGHVTSARRGKIKDWSWAEKESTTAPRSTKREIAFQLKVADKFERVGGRNLSVYSTQDLKDQFGLRDVQSGNWVLNDPQSAEFHVTRSAEAFADLADIMGASDNTISMNGRLAIAFGARGHGNAGFSGAARAHYEAVHRVINLTKMGGGGTLAHEWWHALDNMVKEAEGGGAADKHDYASANPQLIPESELHDAFYALRSAIMDGTVRAKEKFVYTDRDHRLAKHNVGNSMYPNQVARLIKDAKNATDAVDQVRKYFLRSVREKETRKQANTRIQWERLAVAHHDDNPQGAEVAIESGRPMSSFAREAIKLDGGDHGKYYSLPHELSARAFQAYVEDKLASMGRRNDYLSVFADNKHYFDPIFGQQNPFPEGEERTRINAAFDRVVAAMRKSDTLAKAAALLS